MTADFYRSAAVGWAQGATLVYAPIAAQLVQRTPIALTDARVLDIGAGTGVCEAPLRTAGATEIVGADLSYAMLAWHRATRPPAVVSDVMRLPFRSACFDAAVASFVLYRQLKANAAPLLGAAGPMRTATAAAGLIDIDVHEVLVDVHVTKPEALVDYRFGQAQFADWLAGLHPVERTTARAAAAAAITPTMQPYRPNVVFVTARTAT